MVLIVFDVIQSMFQYVLSDYVTLKGIFLCALYCLLFDSEFGAAIVEPPLR